MNRHCPISCTSYTKLPSSIIHRIRLATLLTSILRSLIPKKLTRSWCGFLKDENCLDRVDSRRLTLVPAWLVIVSFPDHFSPHGKNWSGERPIPFPPPEFWRSNQVALRKQGYLITLRGLETPVHCSVAIRVARATDRMSPAPQQLFLRLNGRAKTVATATQVCRTTSSTSRN